MKRDFKILPKSSCFINLKSEMKRVQMDFKGECRYYKRLRWLIELSSRHAKLLSGNNVHSFGNNINSSNL